MKKEKKRYNMHHYIHRIESIDRLVNFLDEDEDGENANRSKLVREGNDDLVKKYKKRYPAFAKSEKLRRDT